MCERVFASQVVTSLSRQAAGRISSRGRRSSKQAWHRRSCGPGSRDRTGRRRRCRTVARFVASAIFYRDSGNEQPNPSNLSLDRSSHSCALQAAPDRSAVVMQPFGEGLRSEINSFGNLQNSRRAKLSGNTAVHHAGHLATCRTGFQMRQMLRNEDRSKPAYLNLLLTKPRRTYCHNP